MAGVAYLKEAKDQPEFPKKAMRGIDISTWQGDINWGAIAQADVHFAIIRGTLGSGDMDEYIENNYNGATLNGLSVGVYHYSYAKDVNKAAWDADNVIDKLGGKQLPVFLDLEYDEQGALGRDAVTEIAVTWISHCQNRGYDCNIYSNVNWYENMYYPDRLRDMGCKFWIASYGPNTGKHKPNRGEWIWQYTSVGRIDVEMSTSI